MKAANRESSNDFFICYLHFLIKQRSYPKFVYIYTEISVVLYGLITVCIVKPYSFNQNLTIFFYYCQ